MIIKPNEILCIEFAFQSAEYGALYKIFPFINTNEIIYSLSNEKGSNLDKELLNIYHL